MKLLEIIKTANSNLLRSKLRTLLTILAIFVGSMTLTLTAGLGSGVQDYINKQTDSISLKDSLTILPSAFGAPNNLNGVIEYNPDKETTITNVFLTQGDIKKIQKVDGITEASLLFAPKPEFITREGQKKYRDDFIDVFIKNLEMPLASGSLPKEKNQMILAYKFVEALGFKNPQDAVGKTINYTFKNMYGEPKDVTLTVSGVQLNNLTGSQNRINQDLAQEMFTYQFGTTDASQYGIAYLQKDTPKEKVEEIKKALKELGYNAQTFEDQIQSINTILKYMQLSVNMFAIIVILAASIGIINTLLMAVYERTREIGLMKALGMKGREVFALFAVEAASLGFWGGLIGSIVAIIIGFVLNRLAQGSFLKGFEGFTLFIFPQFNIIGIILGTMIIGLLAGTLPAIKASKLNPIDALRYE